jgi:predicted PurR-regulated permease PerM
LPPGIRRSPRQSRDDLQLGVASERRIRRSPRQSRDDLQLGVASERLGPDDGRRIIIAMAAESPPKLQIPRWIQLVTFPLLLLLIWSVAGAVRHVIFLFLVAGLIALLLNPLVRGITRIWIPRGLGVAIVYLLFAGLVAAASIALGTVVVDQTRSSSHRIDTYFTNEHGQPPQTHAERDVDRLQNWLNHHGLGQIKIRKQANDFVNNIRTKDVQKYTTRAINFVEGAAIGTVKLLFSLVLVLVVSIYMLLDTERLSAGVNRRFPPPRGSPPLVVQIEQALVGYVKGQALLSLIIGVSAGLGLWLLGTLGLGPGLTKYAVLFGAWVAFTELIPYLGPWLGAVPPFIYELVVHPISALWVALLFLFIHQIEGHVVVPNVMGSALRLHPLLVIFGLLAGGEIYGLPGVLVALPLLAASRAIWEFFSDRIELEPWNEAGAETVPIPVEVESESPTHIAPVEPPSSAAQR